LPFEFLMNALRLVDGVPSRLYTERTGLDLATLQPTLDALRTQDLLQVDPSVLATTPLGLQYLNSVLEQFL